MTITMNDLYEFKDNLVEKGTRPGPEYSPNGSPLVWHDQVFAHKADPAAGSVEAEVPLRARGTLGSLQIVLLASMSNDANVTVSASTAFTLTVNQADQENGDFETAGPSLALVVPDNLDVEPGGVIVRFPLPEPDKPWIKPSIEIDGSISGGNVDMVLVMIPH